MICPYCQHPLPGVFYFQLLAGLEAGPHEASRDCPVCKARFVLGAKLVHGPKISPSELERVMNRPSGGR